MKILLDTSRITIPPLENGDLLTRAEFERRYTAMPHRKKAELIEGIVYMASPLRFEHHAEPHGDLMGWLWTYTKYSGIIRDCCIPSIYLCP